MLTAVGFDDQAVFQTDKISNVAVDGQLPFELVADEPLGAKNLPETMFRRCLLAPHPFCALAEQYPPLPLPARATRESTLSREGRGARHWRSRAVCRRPPARRR